MKKVLLVVIDALAARVVLPAIEQGRLPLFARLVERGQLREECTSIFPSITPAATASIATGVYPVDHGIAGAFWYDREDDSAAYFGDDVWVVIEEGVDRYFNDFLIGLNMNRLHQKTLYQRVEQEGLTAAALNFMWFCGEARHQVNAPWLFKLMPGVKLAEEVCGPTVLGLADFAASNLPGSDQRLTARGGLGRRFGFHDETTAEYLLHLAAADPFPDFTLAYFPNNDFDSHANGPEAAVTTLEAVDAHLSEFIEAMGGMERFLSEFMVVISGDHSQTDSLEDRDWRGIDVAELLEGYQAATPGQPWGEGDDVIICPNMRACHVYLKHRAAAARDEIVKKLLGDQRVDQVLWRKGAWDSPQGSPQGSPDEADHDVYQVARAGCETLSFRRARPDETPTGRDLYDTAWVHQGDLACLDARVGSGRQIEYGEYPNALERIATAFFPSADDLWVTARIGHEFEIAETSLHDGGSHGALNREDSAAPLIVAGVPEEISIPQAPRTIDLAPLCLQALGLKEQARELLASRKAGAPK
jgi:hypothetical protein